MKATTVDSVVIGAGVIGLAVADELCRRGQRTAVVSKPQPGVATPASGGMLAPAPEAEAAEEVLIDLALQACREYPDFVASLARDTDVDCDFRQQGSVLAALNHDHEAQWMHLLEAQRRLGLEADWLEAPDVEELEPNLSPRQIGALWCREDAQVSPRRLAEALKCRIGQRGGSVTDDLEHCEVRFEGDRAVGITGRRNGETIELHSGSVVVAAGAWSAELLRPVLTLPMRSVRGQALRLRGEALLQRMVRTPDVYLVPRRDGEIFVGASAEEKGFDSRNTAGIVMDLLREAWRVLPGIYELEVVELLCGHRPSLRDNLPVIGAGPSRGLYLATGHYRHGVMLAPITARLLANVMEGADEPEVRHLGVERFTEKGTQV